MPDGKIRVVLRDGIYWKCIYSTDKSGNKRVPAFSVVEERFWALESDSRQQWEDEGFFGGQNVLQSVKFVNVYSVCELLLQS